MWAIAMHNYTLLNNNLKKIESYNGREKFEL